MPASVTWKHPHMRGEDDGVKVRVDPTPETPPHAWGRLGKLREQGEDVRNTPTCVGKTRRKKPRQQRMRKHPHMRGEDVLAQISKTAGLETPPHAWGRQADAFAVASGFRNTPTCVGKTHRLGDDARKHWKHPHMRGEDVLPAPRPRQSAETPPHAWGRLP